MSSNEFIKQSKEVNPAPAVIPASSTPAEPFTTAFIREQAMNVGAGLMSYEQMAAVLNNKAYEHYKK